MLILFYEQPYKSKIIFKSLWLKNALYFTLVVEHL